MVIRMLCLTENNNLLELKKKRLENEKYFEDLKNLLNDEVG